MEIQAFKSVALAAFTFTGGAICAQPITIETVPVGNVGNAPDTTGFGAVGYSYNIGKYEVTNSQYASFLNAVAATDTFELYSHYMAQPTGGIIRSGASGNYSYAVKSGFENKPVNNVSFWDAARFANWLNNGQGSASTETGSYTLTSGGISGNTVTRNDGTMWVVASGNEWYKAAYYDPSMNSGAGGYWRFPTQSDSLGSNTAFDAANGANYWFGGFANGGDAGPGTTDVGSYLNADSFYGTFDQGGNVWEWTDTSPSIYTRGLVGGSWDYGTFSLSSSEYSSGYINPGSTTNDIGFRLVSLATIPEPSNYGAAMGILAFGVGMMRRRKSRAHSREALHLSHQPTILARSFSKPNA